MHINSSQIFSQANLSIFSRNHFFVWKKDSPFTSMHINSSQIFSIQLSEGKSEMEAGSGHGVGSSESCVDYSFGFDNVNFSDRTLLIEIIDDPDCEHHPDNKRPHWAARGGGNNDLLSNSPASRVKSVNISSLILAARSPFFHKLFCNGMKESEQQKITLRIKASEEVSFMDLLSYIYGNNLPTTLLPLLDLLVTADKFEVVSCLRDCTRLLQKLPTTCESALLYLDLSSILLTSHTIQPLTDAARQFLIAHLKDVDKCKEELLNLPLAGIQAVLSSDSLQVDSECAVYDLVLTWARRHYPDLEERREIFRTHLLDLIRFPLMTSAQLMEVLTCSDMDPELTSKIVIDALYFKSETPHQQLCLVAETGNAASRQFVERAYKFRPVKVIGSELPSQQCITVYLDLKWEAMAHIFPSGHICSEDFYFARKKFYMLGQCMFPDGRHGGQYFGLYLGMRVAESASCEVDYEIASRKKPSEEFVLQHRGSHTFTEAQRSHYSHLFSAPWTSFLADDSRYLINGIFYLRVDLKITNRLVDSAVRLVGFGF